MGLPGMGVSRTGAGLRWPSAVQSAGRWARVLLDVAGLALFGAAAAWTHRAASSMGGSPEPVAALFVGSALAWLVGRLTGARLPWIVPTVLISAVAIFFLAAPTDTLSRDPLSGPFSYANAKAAFFVQAEAAALMLAAFSRVPVIRWAGLAAAVGLTGFSLVSGVLAATALSVGVLGAAIVAIRPDRARRVVAGSLLAFLLALGSTLALAAGWPGRVAGEVVDPLAAEAFSGRRLVLWKEALTIAGEHSATGVGPGRFLEVSPTARRDVDALWAHHGFLQQAAEGGWVALGLLVLLFVWAFMRLWMAAGWNVGAPVAAAALAALGIHACMDYVLHFPAIPLAAAALAGVGAAGNPPGKRVETTEHAEGGYG
jgi:hypothetical protein